MSRSPLTTAAYEAKLDEVSKQIAAGAAVDGSENEKWNAQGDIVKDCLDGAPYYTPLGEAVRNKYADEKAQLQVVDALLAAGAPVNERNYRNETAIHFAAERGSALLVRRLAQAGADVNAIGCLGNAVMACVLSFAPDAPGGPKVETVKALLELGVDPRPEDLWGNTLLSKCEEFIGNLKDKDRTTRARGAAVLELLEVVATDPRHADWAELHALIKKMRTAHLKGDAKLKKLVDKLDAVRKLTKDPTFAAEARKAIGTKAAARHDELRTITSTLLAAPDVVTHPEWPALVRALLHLTVPFAEFAEQSTGERIELDQIEGDESGTFEAYGDEQINTVEHCLRACAAPGASARPDFDELVRAIADHKLATVGTMSFGDDEAAALARALHERKHPTYEALLVVLHKAWPYASLPR